MILLRLLALPWLMAGQLLVGLVAVVVWASDCGWRWVRTGAWTWRP